MSNINDGGPAFPITTSSTRYGMSLRDWFAGQAMAPLMTRHPADRMTPERIAASAYAQADAILAARSNKESSA